MTKLEYKQIKDHHISTKNIELLKTGTNSYILKHYERTVLKVSNGSINHILPASRSTYSAIVQALKYLGIKKVDVKDVCIKLNHKTMEELQKEFKTKITA
ncbi:MAG: hypothetical protein R2685_10970 [Candidatus Nitrosocosmicus sp.]|nr:hypothetical protein [Candidatus Nitrosocosmicus sp.]